MRIGKATLDAITFVLCHMREGKPCQIYLTSGPGGPVDGESWLRDRYPECCADLLDAKNPTDPKASGG